MTSDLAAKSCIPCRGGVPPLEGEEIQALLALLGNDWTVVDDHHIQKNYEFKDFADALGFTNRIGAIAEPRQQTLDLLALQRRHATPAGNTTFRC